MQRSLISACLIVRNEELRLEQCLKSLRPHVDELVIVDTGSNDKTPEIARQFADKFEVYRFCNDDLDRIEDFAKARNRALSLTTHPWVFWVDGDDEVVGAEYLREMAFEADQIPQYKGHGIQIFMNYEYDYDASGNVTCLLRRERLIKNKDSFHWVNPIHELLVPKPDQNVGILYRFDKTIIKHRRQGKTSSDPERNLRILKKWYEKHGESDPRQLYYLGVEYGGRGYHEESLSILKRYCRLSGWDDEKCNAMCQISATHLIREEFDEAIAWGLQATTVRENWFEPYYALLRAFYCKAMKSQSTRDWELAVHFGKVATSKPVTDSLLFINPMDRNVEVFRYLNFAYNRINQVVEALNCCEEALKAVPTDPQFLLNAAVYRAAKTVYDLKVNSQILHKTLQEMPSDLHPLKLDQLKVITDLLGISEALEQPKIAQSTTSIALPTHKERKFDGPLDIVFWIGDGVEKWSPDSLKSGLGGSETAAIYTSKLLAARGHKVRVFAEVGGVFDGVEYLHHSKFKDVECDVFISSRQPWVVQQSFKAGLKLLWIHDVHCGTYTQQMQQWLLKFDAVLVLSEWHKKFILETYPCLNPSIVIKTANGIDHSRFSGPAIKRTNKLVYSSSLDRGLEALLQMFPSIQEQVPGTELHVYYGFDWWKKFTEMKGNPPQELARIDAVEKGLKQPGVFFHGKQSQEVIAQAFKSAKVWAYSTWFHESFCITALEAQAAGAVPVTTAIAGLLDTVGSGFLIEGDCTRPGYQKQFIEHVVTLLSHEGIREQCSETAVQFASKFTWESVVDQWEQIFKQEFNMVPLLPAV